MFHFSRRFSMTFVTVSKDVTTKRFTFEEAVPVFPKRRKGAYTSTLTVYLSIIAVSVITTFAFDGLERMSFWGFVTHYVPLAAIIVSSSALVRELPEAARAVDIKRFSVIDSYFRNTVTPEISSWLDEVMFPDASEEERNLFSYGGHGVSHTLYIAYENKFIYPDAKRKREASYGGVLRQQDTVTGNFERNENFDRHVKLTYIDRNTVEVSHWIADSNQ
jgi:hypothetical protein